MCDWVCFLFFFLSRFNDGCVLHLFWFSEKKEEESKDIAETVLDDEDPPYQDDPKDLNYQPLSQRYT